MKKLIGVFFGIVVLMILGYYLLIGFVLTTVVDGVSDANEDVKELVGEEITIKNDTLEIVDYSMINSNYILEDGRTVSFDYAKKKLIKSE